MVRPGSILGNNVAMHILDKQCQLVDASEGAFECRIRPRLAISREQVNNAGKTRRELAIRRWQLSYLVSQGVEASLEEGRQEAVVLRLYQATKSSVELAGLIAEDIDTASRAHVASFVGGCIGIGFLDS